MRRPEYRLMYNEDPFLSLPAGTGRQPHQSGWYGNTFFPASARIGAMRAHHADLQQKSGASSSVPGLSPAANEVATTPEWDEERVHHLRVSTCRWMQRRRQSHQTGHVGGSL